MNEFIFWDNIAKNFYDNISTFYDKNENYKCVLVNGKALVHYYYSEYEEDLINPYKEDNTIIPFQYIGLNDIENNKIYVDCSIVEFDYKYLSGHIEKTIGCFVYSKNELAYKIKLIGTPSENCIGYWKSDVINLRVIDTIQENKLGLIKE